MKSETHTFWNNAGEPATVTRKTSTSLPGLAIDRWDKADVPAGLGRWVVTHLPTDKRAQEWGETTAAEYGWRLMEVRRFDSLPTQQQDYYHRLYGWKDTP